MRTIPTPRCPPTSVFSTEAIVANRKGQSKPQTPSQRYASLLFECGLGYPLWRPAPRFTQAGNEHTINIGDVGVVRNDLPYHTLFNIAQPKDSPANRDGVPEGADPPCIILPEDITMDDKSGENDRCYIWPKESILSENVQEDSNGSRIFNFTLTSTHGALLLLPQGSVLENLDARKEFLSRIQHHWPQWYDWVEQTKKVDLGDQQGLYVVTGVEKCSTWANASWDPAVGSENPQSLSLKLTVDGSNGRCYWAYSTSRCQTQSAKPLSSGTDSILKHTIFMRGFRVDQRGSIRGSSPLPAPMDFEGDNGNDDENPAGDRRDDDFGGNGRQQNHSSSFRNSSSHSSGQAPASSSGHGHSGGQSRSNFSLGYPQSNMHIMNLSGSESNSAGLCSTSMDLLANVAHPCKVINDLAFELISNLNPALLDDGCIAISHDDDWMDVIQDSDEELPSKAEIIRRVSAELKYIVQGDTIYTSRMSNAEIDLVQQSLSLVSVQNMTTPIPLLIEFRETKVEPEGNIQTATNTSAIRSDSDLGNQTPLLPHSESSGKWNEKFSDLSTHAPGAISNQSQPYHKHHNNPLVNPLQQQESQSEHLKDASLSTASSLHLVWKEEPQSFDHLLASKTIDPKILPQLSKHVKKEELPDLIDLEMLPESSESEKEDKLPGLPALELTKTKPEENEKGQPKASAASDTLHFQRHRRRGAALSCAECRSNCVKKGAEVGMFSTEAHVNHGFVLANTEVLHEKITQLASRVRTLEDALATSHSKTSLHSHPLLSEDLLQIKRPLERMRLDQPPAKDVKEEGGDTIDAVGSLAISPKGRTTFFGQTANSWYLLQNKGSDEDEQKSPTLDPIMPTDIPWLSYAFPFASSANTSLESLRPSIMSLLPKANHARHLSNIYYRHAAWMYTPILQDDFNNLVFRPIYEGDSSTYETVSSHNLSIIYMILAIGTLLDLDKAAHSPEALQYYHLGRAALSIDGVFEEQSIPAIQAL
ncbi:hypothetical protein V5O48_014535, partial [Marasmius crinis-equi]